MHKAKTQFLEFFVDLDVTKKVFLYDMCNSLPALKILLKPKYWSKMKTLTKNVDHETLMIKLLVKMKILTLEIRLDIGL